MMRRTKWLSLALAGLAASACDDVLSPGDPGALVPLTAEEDGSLPAIEMNGSRFHLETFGNPSSPVIVFLHGGPGGDYRGLLRLKERHDGYSLADEYFLVFWDQRGAGLSTRHSKAVLNIDQYTEDLNTLVDRYSALDPVFLVGHSWGGQYATRYINEHPERVAGAVLIEPGPLDGAAMEEIKDDLFDLDFGAEWLNDWAWSSQFLSPDDHARMDYERAQGMRDSQPAFHLSRVDPEPFWRLGAAANRYITEDGQDEEGVFTYDFTTNLAAFTTPVLFITGSLNEVLTVAFQQEQATKYPSAIVEVVDDAGHDVPWVRAGEVVALIRTYLDARRGGDQ